MPTTSAFFITGHESGAGNFLVFPAFEEFKLTRLIDSESGEVTVLEGVFHTTQTYMDWGFSPRDPTIYHYYVLRNGEYELESTWEMRGEPQYAYNPIGDPQLSSAVDPRDAMVVFFATRLAQMVRSGEVRVGNVNHASFFPVRRAYGFDAAELPAVAGSYSEGAGRGADMGGMLQEEVLQVKFEITAANATDLDAVSSAMRQLTGELESFLVHLDCIGLSYGGFNEYLYGEERGANVEPQFFGANITYGTTMYSRRELRRKAGGWTMLPSWTPKAQQGRAVITAEPDHTTDFDRLERRSRVAAGLAEEV